MWDMTIQNPYLWEVFILLPDRFALCMQRTVDMGRPPPQEAAMGAVE